MVVPTLLATLLWSALPGEPSPRDRAPLLEIQVGAVLSWRSYTLVPNSGVGVAYRTSRPYPGFLIDLELNPSGVRGTRPLPNGTSLAGVLAERFGLEVRYSQGWAQSRFMDASAQIVASRSSEWRASIDMIYRVPVSLLSALPTEVRGRLGAGMHRFTVEQTESGLQSSRRSLRLGIEAVQPLIPSRPGRLALHAGFVLMPYAGPGKEAQTAHGLGAGGWGMEISAGAQGALDEILPQLGWRFGVEYTRYADQFLGPGLASQGGSAVELFPHIVLAATTVW
jgi:hypothetical protein